MSQIYSPRYPYFLRVTSGRMKDWEPEDATDYRKASPCVVFLPDGMEVVSGVTRCGFVSIMESRTRKLHLPVDLTTNNYCRIAALPDGKLLARGSKDGTFRIWDSNTGACLLGPIAAHRKEINSIAFSPDSSRIVTGSDDRTVKVWDVVTGDLCLGPLIGHTNDVISVAFSPDGTLIASGSGDNTVRVWDASTGAFRSDPLLHATYVRVAFSADGQYLATCSETIRLWDVTRGFAEITATPLGRAVRPCSFSPDSSCLVAGSYDGSLQFWKISAGSCEQLGETVYGHYDNSVESVAFSLDGLSVAAVYRGGILKVWTVPTTSTQPPADDRLSEKSPNVALDRRERPALSDTSFIDKNTGWMYDSRRDDASVLFWVPRKNRGGFWWPGNTAVTVDDAVFVGPYPSIVTQIDFTRFAHGDDWAECRQRSELSDSLVV